MISENREQLKEFSLIYRELHKIPSIKEEGLTVSPATTGFQDMDKDIKDIVLKLSKMNVSGFIEVVKPLFISMEESIYSDPWNFWGCKESDLESCIPLMKEYLDILQKKDSPLIGENPLMGEKDEQKFIENTEKLGN